MCFSAEASFGAGTFMSIAGIVLVKKFYNTLFILIALSPLFFGIQQLSEGIIWKGLTHHQFFEPFTQTAMYVYLFFAYMFWPVWWPLAFGLAEKTLWRQIVMGGCFLIGLLFFFMCGYDLLVHGNQPPRIVGHSIDYGPNHLRNRIIYGIITILPLILSTIPKMWILGIVFLFTFIAAEISYHYAFTSIWCFVCAIATVGFFIFLKNPPKINQELL